MKKMIFILSCVFVLIFKENSSSQIMVNLQPPLSNYKVGLNNFGRYGLVKSNKWHIGEDANASAGAYVYAMGNGTVKRAQTQTGYGGMYIIEHTIPTGEKISAVYVHMNIASFTKSVGQTVSKGEHIGNIGNYNQNGGWTEHFHFGIRKGAYPSDPNAHICGDWIFSGYTACSDVLNNWYDPIQFIQTNNYIISHQYDFKYNYNPQGWTTGYDTAIYKDSKDTETFGVRVIGPNPGIVSPQYPIGLAGRDLIIHFSMKQKSDNCSFLIGKIWVKDETDSWNNSVQIELANADYGYNSGAFKSQDYNLYRANFSVLRSGLEVRQFSIELSDGCGFNEYWVMDWLKIYQKDPIVIAASYRTSLYPPENLTASAVSSSQINLNWNRGLNPSEYSAIQFNIYRNEELIANTAEVNYSDSGLNSNTQYCYKISAYLGNIESAYSTQYCATTLSNGGSGSLPPLPPISVDIVPPAPPENLKESN